MANTSIKGYAFEYFIRKMLMKSNFTCARPDNQNIVYKAGAGLMIQGLGQAHNADVLMDPPIQIPFYFPSRLLVECKCYTNTLGLPFVRNILGLREDINGFDVVDKDILKNRKNSRRKVLNIFPFDRYHYQVALASLSGFKVTAQEFAYIHNIPLLSFESYIFNDLKNAILSFDEFEFDKVTEKKIVKCLQSGVFDEIDIVDLPFFNRYIKLLDDFVEKSQIAMLENGTLLFLIKGVDDNYHQDNSKYGDGVSLHWGGENNIWVLHNAKEKYYFELPDKLFNLWATRSGSNKEERAIDLKRDYFKNIILFKQVDSVTDIEVLHLSKKFIEDAIKKLKDNGRLRN